MIPAEALALAAACCLALSGMFYAELKGQVSIVALTRWQTVTAFLLTSSIATLDNGWSGLTLWHLRGLAGSGLFAIIIASSALNASIFSLGARRSALVFSLNAPLTTILGYFVLGESLPLMKLAGIALVVVGIVLAILFVRSDRSIVVDPSTHVPALPVSIGLVLGVVAAFGQAIGTLFARPVMASGIDPFAGMAIRAGTAAVFFTLLPILPIPWLSRRQASWKQFLIGITGACIGIGFGMSLLMAALVSGKAGVVSTLSSLVPILVLPMIWVRTGQPPPGLAWLGAAVAVSGTALLALG